MTLATASELDAFADKVEAATAWTPQMNIDLYNLIAPLSLKLQNRTLAKPTSNCFDSLLPWKPNGWKRDAMAEVPLGAYAGFVKFQDSKAVGPVRVASCQTKKLCATLTLALVAATARVWSYELHPTQDWMAGLPRGAMVATV